MKSVKVLNVQTRTPKTESLASMHKKLGLAAGWSEISALSGVETGGLPRPAGPQCDSRL